MVERFHRRLKEALIALGTDEPQNWYWKLPMAMLAIRTTVKPDIGASPSELVYGEGLAVPGEVLPKVPATDDQLSRRREEMLANLRLEVARLQPTETSAHRKPLVHLPDDLQTCAFVFVRRGGVQSTLASPYTGPYRVISRNDANFRIAIPGRENETVSISRVKPAYSSIEDAEDAAPPTPPPPGRRPRRPQADRQADQQPTQRPRRVPAARRQQSPPPVPDPQPQPQAARRGRRRASPISIPFPQANAPVDDDAEPPQPQVASPAARRQPAAWFQSGETPPRHPSSPSGRQPARQLAQPAAQEPVLRLFTDSLPAHPGAASRPPSRIPSTVPAPPAPRPAAPPQEPIEKPQNAPPRRYFSSAGSSTFSRRRPNVSALVAAIQHHLGTSSSPSSSTTGP